MSAAPMPAPATLKPRWVAPPESGRSATVASTVWAGGSIPVTVLTPAGALAADTVLALTNKMPADLDAAVVVDINDCVTASRDAVDDLDAAIWQRTPGRVCVVCRRHSGRRLVAVRPPGRIAVFQRIEDAVQALVFHNAGHGPGWSAP